MVNVKVQDANVLMMVTLLSDYDMILVVEDGQNRYYISEVSCLFENCLELKRLFATSSYTDCVRSIVPVCENEFICEAGTHQYTFIGLHKKREYYNADHARSWFGVLDVIDNVDYSKTVRYADKDYTYLILTPESFGELTKKEYYQIQTLINTYLDGNKAAYQVPRTIYFKVKNNDRHDIYIGIYDLGFKAPLNTNMVINHEIMISMSDENLKKCKMLLEHILES